MPTAICLFNDDFWEIVGQGSVLSTDPDARYPLVKIVLIERIEAHKSGQNWRRIWTPIATILTLPSCIDYEVTEWSLGVVMGQNEAKNNQDNFSL